MQMDPLGASHDYLLALMAVGHNDCIKNFSALAMGRQSRCFYCTSLDLFVCHIFLKRHCKSKWIKLQLLISVCINWGYHIFLTLQNNIST